MSKKTFDLKRYSKQIRTYPKLCGLNQIFPQISSWMNLVISYSGKMYQTKNPEVAVYFLKWVPKNLNPALRDDIQHLNNSNFESFWEEISFCAYQIKRVLLHLAYSPNNRHTNLFLENLACDIDCIVSENEALALMVEFSVKILNNKCPKLLRVCHKSIEYD